jgi:HK97 family phage portal protein
VSLFATRGMSFPSASELIPARPSMSKGQVTVTNDTALRHSAVWACLRLRANMISTLPLDVYRRALGIQVEVTPSPFFTQPSGPNVSMHEWRYSTQFDLDRAGNSFGIIRERDRYNLPSRIDLVALGDVSVVAKGADITGYRIAGKGYPPEQVWHEKQYTVAGLPVGLSPVAHAAWAIGEYLSIQDFALEWFGRGAIPAAELKNTARVLKPAEVVTAKQTFNASVKSGELFVHGSDWEYRPIQAENMGTAWLDAKRYGIADVARFFDCPGDLIDAEVSTGHITYASITQRNLQFLIMNLQPAITRREDAFTSLTPRPQYVKLNTDALLRMDPSARAQVIKTQIDGRWLAPSEARALEDRPPFTEEQYVEFERLFATRRVTETVGAPGPIPGQVEVP